MMSGLLVVLLAPVLGALAVGLAGARWTPRVGALVGVVVSLVSLAAVLVVWFTRSPEESFAGEVDHVWIEALSVHWHLGVDGASVPLVCLTAVLSALCCAWLAGEPTSLADVSRDDTQAGPSTHALLALVLVVEAASIGVFVALDLLLFFVFFELALVPMWFVIAWWGDPHDEAGRRQAATRFLLFTVTGSALMLVGFVGLAARTGTLQIPELATLAPGITGTFELALAGAIALGLAVKTPIWPLHIWLPDAHASAPTVGSVLLAGVFLKLGTYGFIRILVPVLPEPTARLAPYLAGFAVVGIVYSALACLRQRDLKRLIAYSSVGHMGFVVLGIATLNESGMAAAIFASVAHGVITGLLFFLAGAIKDRHGTAVLARLGHGMYARAPWLAVAFGFGCLASLGVPGLAGFWGELLALRGAYEAGLDGGVLSRATAWTVLGVAAVGIALTTAYFTGLMRRLLQGDPAAAEPVTAAGTATATATAVAAATDLDRREAVVVGVLVLATVLLGLLPLVLTAPIGEALPWLLGGGR